jgi:hypothetical protein
MAVVCGMNDAVGAIDGGCAFIDAGMLKHAEQWGSSSAPGIGSMVWVADQFKPRRRPGPTAGL